MILENYLRIQVVNITVLTVRLNHLFSRMKFFVKKIKICNISNFTDIFFYSSLDSILNLRKIWTLIDVISDVIDSGGYTENVISI